jgi:AraC-like DNA-binding protein
VLGPAEHSGLEEGAIDDQTDGGRLFAKYVGVSPKRVIQRYRLHEAAERFGQAERSAGYADLALELGHSDQAHFVRDFKAIVGVTPAVYARR